VFKTAAVKTSEMVIVTLIRLVSVPLFLHTWNSALYGEWLILTTLHAYLQMANLGFAQTAANEMTMAVARGDRAGALRAYHSTAVFLAGVSLFVVAVAWLASWLFPLGRWMNLSLVHANEVRSVLVVLAACVAFWFMTGLLLAGYRCEGKYHRGLLFVNLFLMVEFGATVAVLAARGGPVHLAWAMLGARVLTFGLMFLDLHRLAPWITLGWSSASWSELRRMLPVSLSFMSYPLSMVVIDQGVVLAIGTIINPSAVVLFTAMRTLTNMVLRVFELVNQAISPEVSMAWGVRDQDLLRRLHRTSCQASVWIGVMATVFLVAFGRWVFALWTGGEIAFDPVMLHCFLGVMVIRSAWYTSQVMSLAINRYQRIGATFLVLSMLSLPAFVITLKVLGLYWAFLALAGLEVAMTAAVVPTSLKLTSDRLGGFLGRVLRPPDPFEIVKMVLKKRAHDAT
jgi:O-antigen/teichoic acid export membrane protein